MASIPRRAINHGRVAVPDQVISGRHRKTQAPEIPAAKLLAFARASRSPISP